MPKIAIEKSNDKDEYHLLVDDTPLATLLSIPRGDNCTARINAIYMAQFPVTQELYKAVMGKNPARFEGKNNPVEQVMWYDAVAFCEDLNKDLGIVSGFYSIDKTRKDENNKDKSDKLKWAVNFNPNGSGFRLPTEAEWRYASKGAINAMKTVGYAGSKILDHVGWYENNNDYETKPSGLKFPNAFGLYDMSGNVEEWCWDWYSEYDQKALNNPTGAKSGVHRVAHGGSWISLAAGSRPAARDSWLPLNRSGNLGFRLVFVP